MVKDLEQLKMQLSIFKQTRVRVWHMELIRWMSSKDDGGHYYTGSSYAFFAMMERVQRYQDGSLHLDGTRWQPKDHS